MPKSVVTLGTFDGVHRGHQALLGKVIQRSRAIGATSAILSFEMPPRHAGEPLSKAVLLTTLQEKLKLFKKHGIRLVHRLVFDRKTASTSPEDFFNKTILKKLGAREMIVGPKVAFGKNRAGRLALLRKLGRQNNVRIHVVGSITTRHGPVSSRRIRQLLRGGHIEKANALLGYPYSAEGKVVHGDHRGRRIGYPTANLDIDAGKILPPGVFFVKVLPGNIDGLCNVGTRPTFTPKSHQLHCEVFLMRRMAKRLYGRRLRVVFLRKIRAERRFRSAEALKAQIKRDLAHAHLYQKSHFSI